MTATTHWAERLPEFNTRTCRPLERLRAIEAEIASLHQSLEMMQQERSDLEATMEALAKINWTREEIAAAKKATA